MNGMDLRINEECLHKMFRLSMSSKISLLSKASAIHEGGGYLRSKNSIRSGRGGDIIRSKNSFRSG